MENAYLTIKEAMAHTGRSEETIRRWVRHTRAQYQVELDETNDELEPKTHTLRKQNEANPDGSPRRDKHGVPVFEWLLQKTALDESFPADGAQSPPTLLADPPHAPSVDTDDDTHPVHEDSPAPTQSKTDSPHEIEAEDPNDDTHPAHEDASDPPQEEYLWMPRGVYEGLLAQLEAKDVQLSRKDDQLAGC